MSANGGTGDLLKEYREFLPTLFGVSQVTVGEGQVFWQMEDITVMEEGVRVLVEKADGTKCVRCWRYVPEISQDPDRTGLCPRCVEALAEPVSL